jgi:hypothetical protein
MDAIIPASAAHEPLSADAAEIGAFVAALLAQTLQPAAATAEISTAATAGAVFPDPRQALAVRQLLTANPARGAAEPTLPPHPAGEPASDWTPIAANAIAAAGPLLSEDGLEAALSPSLLAFEGEPGTAERPVPSEPLIAAADIEQSTVQVFAGDAESPLVQSLQRLGETGTVQHAYTDKASPLPMRDPALFAERLNQQVALVISQHAQHARLAVNPPELGPVEVRVTVIGDEATIQLAATHAATREALEEALPRLRAAFADSGIALGHAGVFTEMPERHPDPRQADAEPREFLGTGADEPPAFTRVQLGLLDAFV